MTNDSPEGLRLSEPAPAKVNLSLRVLGRRADGYHELDSLVAFADCGDLVTIEPGGDFALSVSGPFAAALDGGNILEAAARLFANVVPGALLGRVELQKNLPVAAGLGGGSADAAALLRLLCRLNPPSAHAHDWAALATRLGADVPVCLASQPCRMTGIGERLQHLDAMPKAAIVLVNPRVPLSTAAVFGSLGAAPLAQAPDIRPLPRFRDLAALVEFLASEPNDLQPVATRLCPPIADVLDKLRHAPRSRLVRMSGSGPTCFALFDTLADARAVAERLRAAEPGWWCAAANLGAGLPADAAVRHAAT
ncbi:MAG: 4-(cytidine 5'-diphospho)-2-C-methyl-D-erythritol kinase [Hyphomicrobiaceae bacterium]